MSLTFAIATAHAPAQSAPAPSAALLEGPRRFNDPVGNQ